MITTEITKLQYDIYGLLAERRLKDAFGKLALLVNELQDWVSRDKLNEMETSYRYMIQYMLDGVGDPERKKYLRSFGLSVCVDRSGFGSIGRAGFSFSILWVEEICVGQPNGYFLIVSIRCVR